jgi:hypothetical protein
MNIQIFTKCSEVFEGIRIKFTTLNCHYENGESKNPSILYHDKWVFTMSGWPGSN